MYVVGPVILLIVVIVTILIWHKKRHPVEAAVILVKPGETELVGELLLDFNAVGTAEMIEAMLNKNKAELTEKVVDQMVKEILSFYAEHDRLLQSTTNRDIDKMRISIREIEIRQIVEKLRVKYKAKKAAQQLETEVGKSKPILMKFDEMEKMKKKIEQLKQSVISEIRSYGSPPDGVHQVMMATYILLGQRKKDVEVTFNFISLSTSNVQFFDQSPRVIVVTTLFSVGSRCKLN